MWVCCLLSHSNVLLNVESKYCEFRTFADTSHTDEVFFRDILYGWQDYVLTKMFCHKFYKWKEILLCGLWYDIGGDPGFLGISICHRRCSFDILWLFYDERPFLGLEWVFEFKWKNIPNMESYFCMYNLAFQNFELFNFWFP